MNTEATAPSRVATGLRAPGNRFAVLNAFVDFALPLLCRADAMTWLVL